jgi:ribonuclease VapC
LIIDTSALIAILRSEPDAEIYATALAGDPSPRISAANYLETGIVIDVGRDAVASRRVDDLCETAGLVVAPVTHTQALIARAAYRDFGKGSGHPAGLNFGDCFAYALAKETREPLLFKGEDFQATDVVPAVPPPRTNATPAPVPIRSAGRCLCGGVAYTVTGPLRDVVNCHCERCRRTTGHLMAATQAAAADLQLEAEDTLQWYVPVDAPKVAYGFCKRCGGSLFWRVNGATTVSICAGTLDQPTGLSTVGELFAAEAGDYHRRAQQFRSFAGDRPRAG